jgi:hypothetical protein
MPTRSESLAAEAVFGSRDAMMGCPPRRSKAIRRIRDMRSWLKARAIAEATCMIFIVVAPALATEAHLNVSLSGGVYQPWYGDTGHSAILSAQYALRADRFWIGIEVEHRAFEANVGSGFSPEYNAALFRGLFHYHPFPDSTLSPYVGLGTGFALHVVDRHGRVNGERKRYRERVSGGMTFLGLIGLQTRFPGTRRLSVFTEMRIESASDVWEKSGASWRYDQVGGVTGSLGLRMRF